MVVPMGMDMVMDIDCDCFGHAMGMDVMDMVEYS